MCLNRVLQSRAAGSSEDRRGCRGVCRNHNAATVEKNIHSALTSIMRLDGPTSRWGERNVILAGHLQEAGGGNCLVLTAETVLNDNGKHSVGLYRQPWSRACRHVSRHL